jgi:hypothetical protein
MASRLPTTRGVAGLQRNGWPLERRYAAWTVCPVDADGFIPQHDLHTMLCEPVVAATACLHVILDGTLRPHGQRGRFAKPAHRHPSASYVKRICHPKSTGFAARLRITGIRPVLVLGTAPPCVTVSSSRGGHNGSRRKLRRQFCEQTVCKEGQYVVELVRHGWIPRDGWGCRQVGCRVRLARSVT